VATTREEAKEDAWPSYAAMMNKIGRERGWSPIRRQDFDASTTIRGANFVGSPEDVAQKLLYQHELFGHQRFLLQLSVGTLPHAKIMRAIELLGTEVAAAVRAEVARRAAA
jgi:alkanesulfonate monooxygenase SsuD/methylene tetrahydromethanopterin reductase-like flavin-dependent oxidoreductase (luciferase family)